MSEPLLEIDELTVVFDTDRGLAQAVDRLSLTIAHGEMLGLAGESGSGKSTVAHAIMRLIAPPGHIVRGSLKLDGIDVLALDGEALRRFRWTRVSLVSQNAMNALNPVKVIRETMRETFAAHRELSRAEADAQAARLLRLVGLPEDRLDSYPHELSGGMRQRVMIALALALDPDLVIMDEPTTALDVVLQREIMREVVQLRDRFGFSVLFITHDLSLLGEFCDQVAIMYAGRIVERAPVGEFFANPRHPYSRRLLQSFPPVTGPLHELSGIPGAPPDLVTPPPGCRFHPRCDSAFARCPLVEPALKPMSDGVEVACHLYEAA